MLCHMCICMCIYIYIYMCIYIYIYVYTYTHIIHTLLVWVFRDVFQDVGVQHTSFKHSPISAFGVKSPRLQFLRVNQLSFSNPTSSNTTS